MTPPTASSAGPRTPLDPWGIRDTHRPGLGRARVGVPRMLARIWDESEAVTDLAALSTTFTNRVISPYPQEPARAHHEDINGGEFVTSESATSLMHAPLLDLDRRAALSLSPAGNTLWVEGIDDKQGRQAEEALVRAGLLMDANRGERVRATPGTQLDRPVERRNILTALHQSMPATPWHELVRICEALLDDGRGPAAHVGPAGLTPIAIDAPAMLVASSTNNHLYVEYEIPWEAYDRLLIDLAECNVVDPGYALAMRSRGCGYLRLPWVRKPGAPQMSAQEGPKAA